MTKGITRDLFARVMSLPARQRSDILEFLGQSAILSDPAPVAQSSGPAPDVACKDRCDMDRAERQ